MGKGSWHRLILRYLKASGTLAAASQVPRQAGLATKPLPIGCAESLHYEHKHEPSAAGGVEVEHDQTQTNARLIKGLYRRRWADLALATLAGAQGPYRQADLKLALVTRSGSFVHHRAFSNAMSYLEANRLVVRRDERPGVVRYEIADLGRVLHAQLDAVEHAVHERHPDDDAQQSSARGHHRPEQ